MYEPTMIKSDTPSNYLLGHWLAKHQNKQVFTRNCALEGEENRSSQLHVTKVHF